MADEEGSLTQWLPKLKSSDRQERDEAARRVTEAYTGQLLSLIQNRLGRGLGARVDAEDVLQSAFASFFGREASFANRNAMFAYVREIALHKTANVRRHHRQEKRDVRREVSAAADSADNILEQGRKPAAVGGASTRRPYLRRLEFGGEEMGEADSFFDDETVESMVYSAPPDVAATILELCECLREHDVDEHDCLLDIVRLALEGHRPQEISTRLDIAKRTVERKLELIAEIWEETKTVLVKVEGESTQQDGRLASVLPRTTARVLLDRLKLSGYRLAREIQSSPGRYFAPSDELYGHVADGDTLLASSP